MSITITRLGYALGAEISGVDLRQPLDDHTVAAIRKAWVDHVVVCFPGQNLDPRQQMEFCARFGVLDDHRARSHFSRPDFPEVSLVVNQPVTVAGKRLGVIRADAWHSDMSFSNRPASASFLNAKQLPPIGGDTMFANMVMAYEQLAPSMKNLAEGLQGVHDVSLSPGFPRQSSELQAERRRNYPPVVHPVVRIHPETGRKALFVGGFLRHFVGFSESESKPLIDYFNRHATTYEFVYRHRWRLHDMLMWDNRSALHYAVQDYDQSVLRSMQRCTLFAPISGEFYRGAANDLAA